MTTPVGETSWMIFRNGQQTGPFPLSHLQGLVASGQLSPDDKIWSQGLADWIPASHHPVLFPKNTSGPRTPPPLPPQQMFAPPPPRDIGQDAGMRMLIPVGRSPLAIAAGYLGLFSVLLIFAPFALLCGILALRQMKRDPSLHGAGRAWFGIIMGVLGTGFLIFVLMLRLSK